MESLVEIICDTQVPPGGPNILINRFDGPAVYFQFSDGSGKASFPCESPIIIWKRFRGIKATSR